MPAFMERAIVENDFVLIVCTPRLRNRWESRLGGVGFESNLITAQVFAGGADRSVIPILRSGNWDEASPMWLRSKSYVDLSDGITNYEQNYRELVNTILGTREQAPPIGVQDMQSSGRRVQADSKRSGQSNDQIQTQESTSRPVSSNLKVARRFSELERERFMREAFDYIVAFFENSLGALESQNDHVNTNCQRVNELRFEAKVFVEGSVKSRCAIWVDSSMGSLGLYYSANEYGGWSKWISVGDNGYAQFLSLVMSSDFGNSEPTELTSKDVAELFWDELLRPLNPQSGLQRGQILQF